MTERKKRWARLLPDYRTIYLSLDELDAHREHTESDAEVLLRSVRYAQRVITEDGAARLLAHDLRARAGLPQDDALALELAMALVVRSRFLAEQNARQVVMVDGDDDGAGNGHADALDP